MLTPEQLIECRKRFKFTQTEMARVLGLTLRGYQKMEHQDEPIRAAYDMAISYLAMQRAVELEDSNIAPKSVRKFAKALTKIDRS